MQIYFRIGKKAKENIKSANNTVLVTESPFNITILTLPPFVKNPRCECGKKADFMLEGMIFICYKCINKEIINSNHMEKEEDISIPLTGQTISKIKFEWSVNQTRWYTVYGRALKPKNWDDFIMKLKGVILNNTIIMFEGEYNRDKKELIIY